MIKLVNKMPDHLKNSLMVQEQLGFALNRFKKGSKEAESVLLEVIERRITSYNVCYTKLLRIEPSSMNQQRVPGNRC